MDLATGFVVSDLHLLASRPVENLRIRTLLRAAERADFLVLNGDTFDFRWTRLPSVEVAVDEALQWLGRLLRGAPNCHVHYVVGNHDAVWRFQASLEDLVGKYRNISRHEWWLRRGQHLFLHGEAAARPMDAAALRRYRRRWAQGRRMPKVLHHAYDVVKRVGAERAVQRIWLPEDRVVRRIERYLQCLGPEATEGVEDVWLGHTHVAFRDLEHRGRRYHNTGSALQGAAFDPRRITADDGAIPVDGGAAPEGLHDVVDDEVP